MAYGVKYRCEWTDIQGVDWKVDILEDSYAGAISAMIASGEPLSIEYLTPGDDLTLAPIKGSMATLNVECTTNFEYIGLYDEEDLVRPVNIYKNEVLYWTGWLSNEYTEPYDNVPYTVSITASDALGILKNIPYKDDGDDYTGRVTESEIILEILAKIGHTQFTEYCNLYEDRMDDDVDDSPFDQAYIDNDLFVDADCYTVLSSIISKYNAVIRQRAGQLIIYRPVELVGDTVYGRVITAASTTGTSITPDMIIDREGLELIDVEGGVLMYKEPMSKLTIEQDYGNRESWIKNHRFNINTWVPGSGFEYWTSSGTFPLGQSASFASEIEGIGFLPGPGYTATQQFGTYAKATTDVFVFSFDYRMFKFSSGAASNVVLSIIIKDVAGTRWLDQDSDVAASWDTVPVMVNYTVASVPQGTGEWATYSLTINDGLPVDGPFEITLCSASVSGVMIAFRNVRFYSTSDYIVLKKESAKWFDFVTAWFRGGTGRTAFGSGAVAGANRKVVVKELVDTEEIVSRKYVVDNAIQGSDYIQQYNIGDCEDTGIVNVLEQFKGALAIEIAGSLKQTAIDFVNSHASAYVAGGVIVTSSDNKIVFTSSVAGTDFTGNTTITNATGDLAGTVENTVANVTGQIQIETLTLSGWSGSCNIGLVEQTFPLDWNTSLAQTAADFVTNYEDYLATYNITVTSSDEDIIFTEAEMLGGFTAPTIANVSGNLDGSVDHTQAGQAPTARVDTITLTGTSGTANVLCDGVTRTATYNDDTIYEHTASWHTRGNAEALPLAELIGNEVADMYSKGRQMVQLKLYELTQSLDVLDNLQDPLNTVGGNNRVFAFNRGTLDCKNREWMIDIIEIGDK